MTKTEPKNAALAVTKNHRHDNENDGHTTPDTKLIAMRKSNISPLSPIPHPPKNMLVVDTSGLNDAFVTVLTRLDDCDEHLSSVIATTELIKVESDRAVNAIRAVLSEQENMVATLKSQFDEEEKRTTALGEQFKVRLER